MVDSQFLPSPSGFIYSLTSLCQVLQNVLNHSNKLSLVKAEPGSQQNSDPEGTKVETNGGGVGGSSPGSDTGSAPVTPPESQSPLHFLADLAEQKSREEKKGERIIKNQCNFNLSFSVSVMNSSK